MSILFDNYIMTVAIEAVTALDMLYKDILPAIEAYVGDLSSAVLKKEKAHIAAGCEAELANKLSTLSAEIYKRAEDLKAAKAKALAIECEAKKATAFHDSVVSAMVALREKVDEAEPLVAEKYLTYPTYGELLFGVNN